MDVDIFGALSSAYNDFLQSTFFYYLKIFSAFVSVLLFIDVVLLLSKRARTDIMIALYGMPTSRFKKAKYIPRWESVKNRLASGSVSSGKIAIIEADKMLNEALEKFGFSGKDADEKIGKIKPGQLVGIEEIRNARILFHKIMEDPGYESSLEELKSALEMYERFFRGVEMID
ncbi:MAG: hypothetical protein UX02_C0001G0009 [Candidatus Moranbacteria bacterium GW2011_GWC1_45_18]|nr:MAG: hypothetical protein UT79_C0002G0388 [Candidatus Moranbacteria bacterium GW2011_GWC2_40_12]KKT34231.1 MAG: hypothetical protein UW19_C0001G0126 [Candidatus Moranbacteria bacterium GW2011_GWF2_44_10]KKT71429.1 MAG: hypothetical protein UW66_C0033G0007 [Candidatus Moranbacteria bacterium GW2011_GWF1_44_4]KKU00561.1 MAG: hypothetical protein UX02_C0001G0009 [Candidatus Moranbacteria bacterium GW2011_GWC1_45_18]OGI24409.1 MAG: hypothetical protein A2194_05020 [Candidatus Moranbacteria bacte